MRFTLISTITHNDMSESYVFQCGGQGPGGKAAWQGCNRPSPLPLSPTSPGYCGDGYRTKQCEAHRRWMKRNRVIFLKTDTIREEEERRKKGCRLRH